MLTYNRSLWYNGRMENETAKSTVAEPEVSQGIAELREYLRLRGGAEQYLSDHPEALKYIDLMKNTAPELFGQPESLIFEQHRRYLDQ